MGSIQLQEHNGSQWIVGTASGDGTFEKTFDLSTLPEDFEPINPTRNTQAWKYDDGEITLADTGTVIQPSPEEAIRQITDYFINVEGDQSAGLDRLDSLLTSYPTAEQSINQEYYDMAKDRIDKAETDGMLTAQEAVDIKAILDGTY